MAIAGKMTRTAAAAVSLGCLSAAPVYALSMRPASGAHGSPAALQTTIPLIQKITLNRYGGRVILSISGRGILKAHIEKAQTAGWLHFDISGKPLFAPATDSVQYAGIQEVRYGWLRSTPPSLRVVVKGLPGVQWKLESHGGALTAQFWSGGTHHLASVTPSLGLKPGAAGRVGPVAMLAMAPTQEGMRPVFGTPYAAGGAHPAPRKSTVHLVKRITAQNSAPTPGAVTGVTPVFGSAPIAPTAGNVSIDVNGVSLDFVLKALAAQTGSNIITAPGVTGNATLSLHDVPLEQALDLITRLNHLAYVRQGNTIIVGRPEDLMTVMGPNVGPVIVSVNRAAVADVTSAVKAAYPMVTATPQGNSTIVLFGPESQVGQAQRYINTLDNLQPNSASVTAMVTLQNSSTDAGRLVDALKTAYPRLNISQPGTGQILLMGDQAAVTGAQQLVQLMDRPRYGAADVETVTYMSKYADVLELQRILKEEFGDNLLAVPGPKSLFVSGAAPSSGSQANAGTGLNGATSMLLLTGTPDLVNTALKVLAKVDLPKPMVYIEARVVDVDLEHAKTIGATWSFSNGFSIAEAPPAGAAAAGGVPGTAGTGAVGGATGGFSIFPFKGGPVLRTPISATVDLLMNDTNNKVLASPNIQAESDRPADIFIGDEIHYVDSIDRSAQGQASIHTNTENVGIELAIMSHVGPDGEITLSLAPNVSVLTQLVPQASGAQLPIISKRSASTVLRVLSGQTVAIGGLIRDEDLISMQKVPLLGDLPFFGALFRHRQATHQRSEVIIFIRATLVPVGAMPPLPMSTPPGSPGAE